jgi:hypothetical protein
MLGFGYCVQGGQVDMLSFFKRTPATQPKHYLHIYKNQDEYRRIQQDGNKHKIEKVWAVEDNIHFLANYLGSAKFDICNGTRRGLEQKWFAQQLNCDVIGTEISETAVDFPNTIHWDFHEDNPEWHEKSDFVYSNALDHAYDPDKAINVWMKTLTPRGCCIIEHSSQHEGSNELDPFGAHIEVMPYLILKWGVGVIALQKYWMHL